MAMVGEEPSGTKNSVNVTFTLSATPIEDSEIGFMNNLSLDKVASAPGVNEYSISGATITLGQAPSSSDELWFRYDSA